MRRAPAAKGFVMCMNNRKFGLLALSVTGQLLPVKVLRSAAGCYLGTVAPSGEPVSRESEVYFCSAHEAEKHLAQGDWVQKRSP